MLVRFGTKWAFAASREERRRRAFSRRTFARFYSGFQSERKSEQLRAPETHSECLIRTEGTCYRRVAPSAGGPSGRWFKSSRPRSHHRSAPLRRASQLAGPIADTDFCGVVRTKFPMHARCTPECVHRSQKNRGLPSAAVGAKEPTTKDLTSGDWPQLIDDVLHKTQPPLVPEGVGTPPYDAYTAGLVMRVGTMLRGVRALLREGLGVEAGFLTRVLAVRVSDTTLRRPAARSHFYSD
jgi:hypothetical protein